MQTETLYSSPDSADSPGPQDWKNPRPAHPYNLVVLGGGYAGILTALEAVGAGAKVALMERDRMGGVCLNAGCISSKAMIRTSRLYADMRNAGKYGDISLAMAAGLGLRRLARVHHPYPTQAAAIKMAAGRHSGSHSSRFRAWFARRWLAW